MSVTDFLARIEAANRGIGRTTFLKSLRNGASAEDRRRLAKRLGAPLPPALDEALSIHDGTAVPDDTPVEPYMILPGFYWNTPAEAFDALEDFPQMRGTYPMLSTVGGDFYAVTLNVPEEVIYFPSYDGPSKIHDSVEAMLETLAICFEERAFYLDADGVTLLEDLERVRPIALRSNPNSAAFWRSA